MKRLPVLVLIPLLLAACGSGGTSDRGDEAGASGTTTGAADAQAVTVGMTDSLTFNPSTVEARVGTVALTVTNLGNIPHNLEFDDKALGKTGTVDGKATEPLKVVFSKAGTFTFVCTFHGGMTGKVVVS